MFINSLLVLSSSSIKVLEITSASFKLVILDDKSSTATLTGPSDRTKFFMSLISSSVIQRDSFNSFKHVFMAGKIW